MAKVSHTHKHTAQNINIRSNFGTIYSGFFSFFMVVRGIYLDCRSADV